MLRVLRYLLLIVTAICFAILTYELWKDHRNALWLAYCIWISLVLNFAYLAASVPKGPTWRLFGLIGLWFDAKEGELRERAKRGVSATIKLRHASAAMALTGIRPPSPSLKTTLEPSRMK
jgi:hypothetical protein